MPRRRRQIESKQVYEICFRARSGLPFVAYKVIALFIKHSLARAQRDKKVYLCHDIWNGSHAHLLVLTRDAEACVQFYGEVQKKITDCLKRLLGLPHLRIWEGRVSVIKLGDLEQTIDSIAYFYANPAQDNLETSIERFPGYSSFAEFKEAREESLTFATQESVPFLRLPSLPALKKRTLSHSADSGLVKLLSRKNKKRQSLIRHPNIWMRAFGVSEKEVPEINKQILLQLRGKEKRAAQLRALTDKQVLGAARLGSQPILKAHTPKKRERKIFFRGLSKEQRIRAIENFKLFCDECARCYQAWRRGDFTVTWPPGAFKPPLPPSYNIITT